MYIICTGDWRRDSRVVASCDRRLRRSPRARARGRSRSKTRKRRLKPVIAAYICRVRYNVTRWGLICRGSRGVARARFRNLRLSVADHVSMKIPSFSSHYPLIYSHAAFPRTRDAVGNVQVTEKKRQRSGRRTRAIIVKTRADRYAALRRARAH